MRTNKLLLLCIGLLVISALLVVPQSRAQDPIEPTKIGSSLAFLLSMHERGMRGLPGSESARLLAQVEETQRIKVSMRFDHELDETEIEALEEMGVMFVHLYGKVAHVGTIYGAQVPTDRVDLLAKRPHILRIESVWTPGVEAPLNISIPLINADDVWQMTDSQGRAVTGRGITIANFDTGIDIFHPAFFHPDGGRYAWIDDNANGVFDPGTDCVDLNSNSACDAGELLELLEATLEGTGWRDGVYDVGQDWLYNDTNGNGVRDFGPPNFTESDSSYGERLFIADDFDGDDQLDIGEELLALGTSKVYKTLNDNGVERVRGTDLILTDPDPVGHGTGVAGVLVAGAVNRMRFTGVAPDADLLVADRCDNDYTVYVPWAEANGAKVMNYEFGGWTGEFLDGSSNLEAMIDTLAANGIVQVAAAGNLGATSDKHFRTTVPSSPSGLPIRFSIPPGKGIERVWSTVLWRRPTTDLTFQVTTPTGGGGNTVTLPGDGTWVQTADGHWLWSRREDSPRGTAKFDIDLLKWDQSTDTYYPIDPGQWTLTVINPDAPLEVDGYISDDVTSWGGGAVFLDYLDPMRTTTCPATADSIITVANFHPRTLQHVPVTAGELSADSGRGPRIDGVSITDIAAPGSWSFSPQSKDEDAYGLAAYGWFGGTSAAAPHVVGAAALLLQLHPTVGHAQIKQAIQQGAQTDAFTGSTPSDLWGYGKLDVLEAVLNVVPRGFEIFLPLILKNYVPVITTPTPTPTRPVTQIWKEGGCIDYAPSGMPDFDQRQDLWDNPKGSEVWSYCGPLAVANCLWWFDSKMEPYPVSAPTINDNYPLVQSYNHGQWDDHDPLNLIRFVDDLAWRMDCDGQRTGGTWLGTYVDDMYAAIRQYLADRGLADKYAVGMVNKPTFDWVAYEVERCEDVILLLGFWTWDYEEGWERVGGHYVTTAGVDWVNRNIAFSNPIEDTAESGWPGRVLSGTLIIPHAPIPGHGSSVHNDAGNISHDIYDVVSTDSPGGTWGPADYAVSYQEIKGFFGQNFPRDFPQEFRPQKELRAYAGAEIQTEVEYAISISPIERPPTPTATATPTVTPTATPTPVAEGIYGQVAYKGAPASGVELKLRFYDGTDWSTAATTTTGSDGGYDFVGVPSLGSGQKYYVRYDNNGMGDSYLRKWYGSFITSYTAGSKVPGGDFDIANVSLLEPPSGVTRALPATFRWGRRELPGDTYRWRIYDPTTGDDWISSDLGDSDSYTLGSLASGMEYGREYRWQVRVYRGSDSYGRSFYRRKITFTAPAAKTNRV